MRPTTFLAPLALLAACGPQALGPADAPGVVGPEGGHVWSPDGRARLDVPPGALAAPIELAIEPIADLPGALAGTSYELSPSGLEFPVSPLLSITLPPEAEATFAPLSVVKFREDGVVIAQLGENVPGARTATAVLVGFSAYAVYGPGSTPLPPPLDRLTASRSSGSTVLAWVPSAPMTRGRWLVERCGPQAEPPRESDWRPLGTAPAGATVFVDQSATVPEAIYWYRVRGVDGALWGRASTMFVGTFAERAPRPLGLRVALREDDAVLSWDPLARAGVLRFEVAVTVDGHAREVVMSLPNTQSAALVRLRVAHAYEVELRAVLAEGPPAVERVALIRAGFRLDLDAREVHVTAGESTGLALTVTRAGAFTAPIAFTWSADAPAPGVHVTFTPRGAGSRLVDVRVTVEASAPPGFHHVTLVGAGGGQEARTTLTVAVEPRVGFDFEVTPAEVHVPATGGSASYAVVLRRSPGFTESIAFTLDGPPAIVDRSSPPTEGGGYLVVEASPRGRYTLSLRAVSAGGSKVVRGLVVWVD